MAAKNNKRENGFPVGSNLNTDFFQLLHVAYHNKNTHVIHLEIFMITIQERYLICLIFWYTVGHTAGGGPVTYTMRALFSIHCSNA
jgi:hypothetical protein